MSNLTAESMKNYSQIYLVDDFDMSNLLHKALFTKLQVGDQLNVFTNPEKALSDIGLKLQESNRILVLLDLNMPEMSGFEFLEVMVKENFPHIIDVIIATSSISENDRFKAEKYQQYVRDFISKPLKIDQLRAVLEPLNRAG